MPLPPLLLLQLLLLSAACGAADAQEQLGAPDAQEQQLQAPEQLLALGGDAAKAWAAAAVECGSAEQLTQCGWLPVSPASSADELASYAACCALHRPFPLTPAAAAVRSAAEQQAAALAPRPDLDLSPAGRYGTPPDWLWGAPPGGVVNGKPAASCVPRGAAGVPTFSASPRGVAIKSVPAPRQLTRAQVAAVKAAALAQPRNPVAAAVRRLELRLRLQARRTVGRGTATPFRHPAGLVGPVELALMLYRVQRRAPPTSAALDSMLTGAGVVPKFYRFNATLLWSPPVDTPATPPGPHAMARVAMKCVVRWPPLLLLRLRAWLDRSPRALNTARPPACRWGGVESDLAACPANYPAFAPRAICGHVAWVELDAQMLYKAALAFHATRDSRYAAHVFDTLTAWAARNRGWGLPTQNGPLEAGWGVCSAARALEVLRTHPGFSAAREAFLSWFNAQLRPQMEAYVRSCEASAAGGNANVWGNWAR